MKKNVLSLSTQAAYPRPQRDTENPCAICGWAEHMAIHLPIPDGPRKGQHGAMHTARSRRKEPPSMSADTTTADTERAAFFTWLSDTYPNTYSRADADRCWEDGHIAALAWQAARRAPAPAPQGPTLADFALQALVAAGHVTQDKVDAAMRLPGAPSARAEPVARKPLTEEQINEFADQCRASGHGTVWPHAFAKFIETAHGIKP